MSSLRQLPPAHPARRRKLDGAPSSSTNTTTTPGNTNDPLNLYEGGSVPQANATLLQYIEGAYQPTGRLAKERVREILDRIMSAPPPEPREIDTITLLYALDHYEPPARPTAAAVPRLVSVENMRRNLRCHIKGERLLPCSSERCLFGTLCRRFAHPLDPQGRSVGLALVHDEQWLSEVNQPGPCLLCLLHWMSDVATSARSLRRTYTHTINPIRVSQHQGDSIANEHLMSSPLIEGVVPFFAFPDYTAAAYDPAERRILLLEGQQQGARWVPALFPKWRLFRRGSRIPRLIRTLGLDEPFVVDLPLPLSTSLLPCHHTAGPPDTTTGRLGAWVFGAAWADLWAWVRDTGYPSGLLEDPVVRERVVLSPLVVPHAPAGGITATHPFFSKKPSSSSATGIVFEDAARELIRGIRHPLPLSDPQVCRAHSLYWAAVGAVNTLLHLSTGAWPGTRHRDFLMERADALGPLLGELARIGAGKAPSDAECADAWGQMSSSKGYPTIPAALLPVFPSSSPCDVCCGQVERELFVAPHSVHEHWHNVPKGSDVYAGLPDLTEILHSLLSPEYAPHQAWDPFLLRQPEGLPDHELAAMAFMRAVLELLQTELASPEAESRFKTLRQAHPALMGALEAVSANEDDDENEDFQCRNAVLRYLARLVRDRPMLLNLFEQRFVFLGRLLASERLDLGMLWLSGPRRAPYTVLRQATIDLGRYFYEASERLVEMVHEVRGTVDPALVQHSVKTARLFRAMLDADPAELDDVETYLVTLGLLQLAELPERLVSFTYALTLDALGGRYLPERCLEVVQAVHAGAIAYRDVLLLRLLLEAFSGELNKCVVRLRRPETAREQAGEFSHRGIGGLVPAGIHARDFFNRCTSLFYCPATQEAHSRRLCYRGSKRITYNAGTDSLTSRTTRSNGRPTNRILTRNIPYTVVDEVSLLGNLVVFPHEPLAFRGISGMDGSEYRTMRMLYNRQREVAKQVRDGGIFSALTAYIPAPPPIVDEDGDLRYLALNAVRSLYCCAECGHLAEHGPGTYACSEGPWCRLCPLGRAMRHYYTACLGCASPLTERMQEHQKQSIAPSLRRASTATSNKARRAVERCYKKSQIFFRSEDALLGGGGNSLHNHTAPATARGMQSWSNVDLRQKRNAYSGQVKFKALGTVFTVPDLSTGDWHALSVCADCATLDTFLYMDSLKDELTLGLVHALLTKAGANALVREYIHTEYYT